MKHQIAVLSMGELKLALPQEQIIAVDVFADAVPNDSGYPGIAAILNRGNGRWPVLAFDPQFSLQEDLNRQCRFFACIKQDELFYALACDAIDLLELDQLHEQALPQIMHSSYTPVQSLFKYNGELVFSVSALTLNQYFNFLGVLDVEKN